MRYLVILFCTEASNVKVIEIHCQVKRQMHSYCTTPRVIN